MAVVVSAQSPEEDATIALGADIDFHLGTSDGVTEATIEVSLTIGTDDAYDVVIAGSPQYPFSLGSSVSAAGDGFDINIVNPGSYPPGTAVVVTIDAEDDLGAVMVQKVYTLTTVAADPDKLSLVQIARGS